MTQHVESPMGLAGTSFSCPVVVGSPGHCPCENLKSYKRKEKQTNEKTHPCRCLKWQSRRDTLTLQITDGSTEDLGGS